MTSRFRINHILLIAGLLTLFLIAGGASFAQDVPPACEGHEDDTFHVAILDADMTCLEVAEAIQAEGGLVVANWTYTANDVLIAEFEAFVAEQWGVDIDFVYEATQSPSQYLTSIRTAVAAGNAPLYDVMAVEENYWAEAMLDDLVAEIFPSDLIPNAELVLEGFRHEPTSIAFQSSATPGITYDSADAPWMTQLSDLADPRLQGLITLPLPGDITSGGFLISLANELEKDYADVDEMREVVDFAVDQIGPNVLKYTSDQAEMQQLLNSEAADAVVFWDNIPKLQFFSGRTQDVFLIPEAGLYTVNGYLWAVNGTESPVLAQIFVNWRISPEVQFPNDWGLDPGPWAELHEGLLSPDFEEFIPEWIVDDYYTYFPTLDQLENQFLTVDWDAYNAGVGDWMGYYSERLGL
jgi:spermidine/putrescine-binding protein